MTIHNVKLYQHLERKCHNLSRDIIFKVNENFQTMEIWGLLQKVTSPQTYTALPIYMIHVRFTSAKIICLSLQFSKHLFESLHLLQIITEHV